MTERTLNIPMLTKVRDWLRAGAPHAVFSMAYDIHTDPELITDIAFQTGQEGKGDCGTVCCIAGTALLMDAAPEGQLFPDYGMQRNLSNRSWWKNAYDAAGILGLPARFGSTHPLFNPDLAPPDCTPDQAADAIERVMRGEHPWPDGEETDWDAETEEWLESEEV